MGKGLPMLVLQQDKHEGLIRCMCDYPHIFEVFRNVLFQRSLDHNIDIPGVKTINIFIEDVFVPLLLRHEVIAEDSTSPIGYRTLIEGFDSSGIPDFAIGSIAKSGMDEILKSVSQEDDKENSVFAYVSCELPEEDSKEFINLIRTEARKILVRQNLEGKTCKRLRFAIAVKQDDMPDREPEPS